MIMWLWRLIFGTYQCRHKWNVISKHRVERDIIDNSGFNFLNPIKYTEKGLCHVMQCEHCGEIKEVKIGAM